ncbi:alpha/beta fold hydrolase [Alisedimentitalea sp. MJ-SS2]|uniref:alpha/beta fold hydrolase n=1 Tax=Aliisedimentitalea sp. MJ-SS2 TaxID=3049795 RepID=UPI002908C51B|nr:alpha/beta fold hydrolase [Alisedimentitalea sp. MJ-SS2]MDU8929888.1 alpha/beta fold hydrolase [Alisedimentitalea sp. MJ-SS2]
MLNTIAHGAPTTTPPLLIAHGLFGSGRNWGVIAKRLSEERQVVAVDMRNHGQSPLFETQSYADMAGDLAEVAKHLGAPIDVMGHSMGGKSSMMLALTRPDLVNRLIVADIAPVAYGHTQAHNIAAMRQVDLSRVEKRSDAAQQLEPLVEDPSLVPFFLQSLDVAEKRWRLNLDVLDREMPGILSFPDIEAQFDGPTLFLSGGTSDYVTQEHRARIRHLFPKARFAKIPGAGHWLHAEKPREFEAAVRGWLAHTGG